MSLSLRIVVLALGLAVVTGCDGAAGEGIVTGEVIVDGKEPLQKGHIRFIPTDAKKTPVEGEISNGKFQVRVSAGESKVEITAPKVIGKFRMAPESPEVDEIAEMLPERYNLRSELKMTVEKGTQEKRFDVESK